MVRPVHGGYWWALVAVALSPFVGVGPAAAETTLEIDAGYAGSFVPGQEVPIRVRISADRLVRGVLEVGVGTLENGIPVALPVEVPGGGQKQFLVTASAGLNQNPDVVARLRQDDRVVATGQTGLRAAGDTELVGLLPGALRGRSVPGVAPLSLDVGTARFAAVVGGRARRRPRPAWARCRPWRPTPTSSAGSRLAPAREFCDGWSAAATFSSTRPRARRSPGFPTPGSPARAGELPPAWARWWPSTAPSPPAGGQVWSSPPDGGRCRAASAGSCPWPPRWRPMPACGPRRIRWLVGFLVVYVVAVGPALFFAVRRRGRPELAWVAVPLVAVVFSTGSYVVGRNLRDAIQLVHASVLSAGPSGPVATTYLGVFSRAGETARVGFPEGWTTGPVATGGVPVATPSLLTRTADGPDLRLPLNAGQFGLAQAGGPAPDGSGLEVTATSGAGGRITGTVRNPTPFRLDAVAVFTGAAANLIGSLGPGEQRDYAVAANVGPGMGLGPGGEFDVWGRFGPMPGADSPADFGLWQAATQMGGMNFLSPDSVVAAGWTRDFVPDVRVGGRTARPEGRTLVLGRQSITLAAQGVAATAARRDIVRDPFANRAKGGFGGSGSVARFVLPADADTTKLTITSPFGGAEIWVDGGWRMVTCEGIACRPPDRGVVRCPPGAECPAIALPRIAPGAALNVPAAAVRDGVVYVRVQGPASIEQGSAFVLGRSA